MSLVPEEKVSFGLYALSVSSLTVARIRKVYNKLDSKAIAKQVYLKIHGVKFRNIIVLKKYLNHIRLPSSVVNYCCECCPSSSLWAASRPQRSHHSSCRSIECLPTPHPSWIPLPAPFPLAGTEQERNLRHLCSLVQWGSLWSGI